MVSPDVADATNWNPPYFDSGRDTIDVSMSFVGYDVNVTMSGLIRIERVADFVIAFELVAVNV
jgi:hypothetical protein